MGVPKFFRYMSERYPCLSQLVQEFEIPEIDNLYLDMNGIIHVCSHPNDFDPHFRISEESIFTAIFHYIEFLFKTIKPQKLFFMAVDGVAPRAKMNQQRGRRFRSAKEAEDLEAQARQKGEKLPDAARFDSNCITPGTVFMDRLHQQLKYFVTDKITNDPLWRDCSVILSGHETPGEGEHKIMDYIRYLKTRPDYDPHMRHCLYGLDADLIMLGLCTHDPHFCLLREEVKYTKNASKRISTPEETKFYLLHLSLMRDYLDLEFQELKTTLPFPYDLEKVIDDWILMGFLVGNDFIPHLPDLHINKGALQILYSAYRKVLPTLDGYLNENGRLNLPRFQKYLQEVAQFDMDNFEELQSLNGYIEGKRSERMLKEPGNLEFFEEAGDDFNSQSLELQKLIADTNNQFETDDSDLDEQEKLLNDFNVHKSLYYRSKMEYEQVDAAVLRSQAEGYIRAIQWNLHYYYHGCQSWSWYYPHHYSPYVSDIINFDQMDIQFDMGKPFLPFHQLLAVLPPASKELLPEAYQPLMTSESSSIIDFYPPEFLTDLNGKIQEWEAVVLIPFIQEDRLLEAMDKCKDDLTDDERRRNSHGPMELYKYTKDDLGSYKSEMFPTIGNNHASVLPIHPHEIAIPLKQLEFGLRPGFTAGIYVPGFPSLRFIPHIAELKQGNVKIFNFPAREKSMLLTLTREVAEDAKDVAEEMLGNVVYVGWPHMVEAKVIAVEDETARYSRTQDGAVKSLVHKSAQQAHWHNIAETLKNQHSEKRGIEMGSVAVVVYACRIEGKQISVAADGTVQIANVWQKGEEAFPLVTTLQNLKSRPPTRKVPKTIQELYPVGDKVIVMVQPNYGAVAEILDTSDLVKKDLLKLQVECTTDPELNPDEFVSLTDSYMTANAISRRLSLNQGVVARITGSCYLKTDGSKSVNVGLNLKFNKKNEEVPGYTRKEGPVWLYSDQTAALVESYCEKFPEIFDFLSTHDTMDFTLEDLYGKGQGAGKDKEIVEWLKAQPHNNVTPIKWGAEIISGNALKSLEWHLDHFKPQTSTNTIKVKPAHTYKSTLFAGNVPAVQTTHKLMDRVVCGRSSYSVPLGLRGYIIGVQKGMQPNESVYDVVFDKAFPSGITLHGSSPHRAYRMPPSAFINITAERRTNPLLKLREMPVNEELRPPKAWNANRGKDKGPSAFAYVSKSPYPGPAPAPLIKPAPVSDSSLTSNQRFQKLWAELQEDQPTPPPQPVKMATRPQSTGEPSLALMKALKIGDTTAAGKNAKTPVVPENTNDRASNALMAALNINQPLPGSNCSALIAHFERKNLGMPKYHIVPIQDAVMAKVNLPSANQLDQFFWGKATSKQAAMELAAKQALNYLKNNPQPPPAEYVPRTGFGIPTVPPNRAILKTMPGYQVRPAMNPPPLMTGIVPQPSFPPRPLFMSAMEGVRKQKESQQVYVPPSRRQEPNNGGHEAPRDHAAVNLRQHQREFFGQQHRDFGGQQPPRDQGGQRHQQPVPGQQWQDPSALPMPPKNWRTEPRTTTTQEKKGGVPVPSSFIPQQALTRQRATRGMGPQRPQTAATNASAAQKTEVPETKTEDKAHTKAKVKFRPRIVANFGLPVDDVKN